MVFFFAPPGSESLELLREFKLLGEVLDHLESNLMVVGTQVDTVLLCKTLLLLYSGLSLTYRYHLLTTSFPSMSLRDMMNSLVSYHEPF